MMPFFFNLIIMKVREIKVSYTASINKSIIVRNSSELYDIILHHWKKETLDLQEEVKAILLNRANQVIGVFELSKGGITGTVIDIKLLMSVALKCVASSIVIIHNHPSGNLNPSKEDIRITKKIKEAGDYLDINLLDHLIISKEGYYSFADEGDL